VVWRHRVLRWRSRRGCGKLRHLARWRGVGKTVRAALDAAVARGHIALSYMVVQRVCGRARTYRLDGLFLERVASCTAVVARRGYNRWRQLEVRTMLEDRSGGEGFAWLLAVWSGSGGLLNWSRRYSGMRVNRLDSTTVNRGDRCRMEQSGMSSLFNSSTLCKITWLSRRAGQTPPPWTGFKRGGDVRAQPGGRARRR